MRATVFLALTKENRPFRIFECSENNCYLPFCRSSFPSFIVQSELLSLESSAMFLLLQCRANYMSQHTELFRLMSIRYRCSESLLDFFTRRKDEKSIQLQFQVQLKNHKNRLPNK